MGGWDDSNDDGFGNSGFGTGGFGSGGFGGGGGSTTVKSSFTTTGKSGGGGFGSKSVSFKGGATSSTSTPRPNSSGGGGGSSWKPKIKDWEPVGNLNKMISVHNIPFFGQTQAFMGRTLWDWFKRSKAHFSDIIDRLNCHIVPMFLMFFVMLISANIFGAFGMEPMRCLRSPELNEEEREYALDYCQSKNTYYVAPEEGIPWSNKERRERQLGYYHWVPIMMFLQSMLFMLPNWLWNALNQLSGVEFIKFIEEATRLKNLELSNPERPTLVHELSERLTEAILNREAYFRRRVVGCRMGRSMGSFVSFLYVAIKLLYLLNVTLQFLILNSFIGSGYTLWGWDVMKALVRGENWQDSPIFPRLTLCDVPIRRLGDVPRYTLQCHLRINTYNEKIYLFIWWGFLLVAGLTFFNFIYYLLTLVLFPWTQENSVRHLLKQERHETIVYSEKKHDKKLIKRFAYEALCKDGVLLFWFIESHAGPIVARDLLGEIFDFYKGKMHEEEDDDTSEKMGLMKKNRGGSFSSSHSTGSTLGDEDDEEAWGHGGGGGVTHRFGTGITPSAPKFSTAEAGNFPSSQERELIDGEEDTTARVDSSHIYSSTPKGPLINGGGGLRRSQNRHGGHDRHSNNRRGSYEEQQGYRPGLLSRAFRFVFGGGGGGGGYYNHNNQQQQPLTMSTPYFSASYYGGKRPSDAAVIKNV